MRCAWTGPLTQNSRERLCCDGTVFANPQRLVLRKHKPSRNGANSMAEHQDKQGKIGWILLWALGVPIPVLIVLFLLRGCT
jgi:hypothetical protein